MKQSPEESASIWFAILERSVKFNDHRRAREARIKLKELGFRVHCTKGNSKCQRK